MTSDTCVLSVKQDGGSGDDRDFLLFWASINGMAPTTTNYEATNEEKAYSIQEKTSCIFLSDSGRRIGRRCLCFSVESLLACPPPRLIHGQRRFSSTCPGCPCTFS